MQADILTSKKSETSTGSIPFGDNTAALLNEVAIGFREQSQTLFLLEAVKDAQSTIRAIDTKVGILLAALAIPLPYLVQGVSAARENGLHLGADVVFAALALVAYVIAGFVAIRALMGTGNAGVNIALANRPPDIFYLGGLYRLGWRDAAYNLRGHVARRGFEEVMADVPQENDGIVRVLVMELMILAFIRDLKIHRQRIAFELIAVAFVLALVAILI